MRHPVDRRLAAYAGGEATAWERLLVKRHLGQCADCAGTVARYSEDRLAMSSLAADIPAYVNWDRLAGEMQANIRLGLVAGQCISRFDRVREQISWQTVVGSVFAVGVAICGFLILRPQEGPFRMLQPHGFGVATAAITLRQTPQGLQLQQNGHGITLLQGRSQNVTYTTSAPGGLRTSYFDADTGQVTISNVTAPVGD